MIGFAELIENDGRCRFPLDDVHWCGAETVGGGSWCAEHRARVFLPPERIPPHLRLEQRRPTAADEVRATWLRLGSAA
ncbi:MAG TPA: hypothetical protein VHA35_00135 [Dongiaceae bacterium]|nr:hypothetical protein [Dongiaceae bacterium]